MKTADIKKAFIECVYNSNRKAYLKARRADYCKVQFEWACFMTPFVNREKSHKSNITAQHFKRKGAAEKWKLQGLVTVFLN